jgi:predicted MFS family arabinose efflux permease
VNASRGSISLRGYAELVRRNPNYRRLWLAQLISGSGDWFYSVAVYSLLLDLTGSAESVAIAVVLQILPNFLAGPTAGVVNDRLSRRKVMLVADAVRAVLVLGLLFIRTAEQIPLLYLLLAMEIATAAFFESGRNAALPSVVEREDIPTANALSSTTWATTVTAGAALGGIAVSFLGREAAFLVNSVSFLVSFVFIWRMRFRETHAEGLGPVTFRQLLGIGPILEGFGYVLGHWRLALLLTLKLGLGILGARVVLVAVLGSREFALFGKPALGMSMLYMFQGLGSLIGPLIAGPFVQREQRRMRKAVLVGYCAPAVAYAVFSQTENWALASLCMTVAHAGGALVWVFSTTLLHMHTDDRFRGRVFAADFGMFMLTASFASYSVGYAIDHGVEARTCALVVGLLLLLPAFAWALSLRRRWDEQSH